MWPAICRYLSMDTSTVSVVRCSISWQWTAMHGTTVAKSGTARSYWDAIHKALGALRAAGLPFRAPVQVLDWRRVQVAQTWVGDLEPARFLLATEQPD